LIGHLFPSKGRRKLKTENDLLKSARPSNYYDEMAPAIVATEPASSTPPAGMGRKHIRRATNSAVDAIE
jgi:hypothetical protein